MPSSAVLVSKDGKRVSRNRDIEAARYRVNKGVLSSYIIDRQ